MSSKRKNRRSIQGRDRRQHRLAVTLLEVLITLVLLAGLGAIVAPTVLDRMDERAFEAAADGTNEQLMMARAHAQATGEAVEVTYSPQTGEVQARLYAPWSAAGDMDSIEPGTSPLASSGSDRSNSAESARTASNSRRSDNSATGVPGLPSTSIAMTGSGDEDAAGHPIAEGWATRPLGRGIRIGTHRPSLGSAGSALVPEEELCLPDSAALAGNSSADGEGETLEDLERGQEVRLAVFMPDGSAMLGQDLWLNDAGGRCGRISINPWSGLPIFQRLADLTNEALDQKGATADDAPESKRLPADGFSSAATDDGAAATRQRGGGN